MFAGYHYLVAELDIDGVPHETTIKIRVDQNGNAYYDQHVTKKRRSSYKPTVTTQGPSTADDPPDENIDPPDDEVKKYSLGGEEMSLADEMTAHVLRYMAEQEAPTPTDINPRAILIADILVHVFGPRIEALLDSLPPMQYAADGEPLHYMRVYEWDEKLHPRDGKGRFAKASTTEQLEATHAAVSKALRAPRTAESAKQLMEHLSQLSVAHLHELKKRHNIGASGRNKAELIEKLAKRLDTGRREADTQAKWDQRLKALQDRKSLQQPAAEATWIAFPIKLRAVLRTTYYRLCAIKWRSSIRSPITQT